MKKLSLLLTLSVLFLFSCNTDEILQNEELNTENSEIEVLNKDNTKGVIHRVSMGGNDICEAWLGLKPGCDANYSLIAIQKADGTIKGQLIDTWAGAKNGIHVEIDCMTVEGNSAIVGGYVKHGFYDGFDITGIYFVAKVVDNGTSQKDLPDQASLVIDASIESCEDQPFYYWGIDTLYEALDANLYDVKRGQVTVW